MWKDPRRRHNPSFLLPATPRTWKGSSSEPPLCWAIPCRFIRQPSCMRLSKRPAPPGERKLWKMMSKWERGSQWKSQMKSKGKELVGFVTVISEVPLSGRSYDFIKFQQVAVPTLLHNQHWKEGLGNVWVVTPQHVRWRVFLRARTNSIIQLLMKPNNPKSNRAKGNTVSLSHHKTH